MKDLIENLTNEEFNYYNPLYCGFLLLHLVEEHEKRNKMGLDSNLIYLALPLIMTKEINSCMPKNIKTSFYSWLFKNQLVIVNFYEIAKDFSLITNETLKLLIDLNLITVSKYGRIKSNKKIRLKLPIIFKKSNVIITQYNTVRFISKWFKDHSAAEIYTGLGVKP